MTARPILIAWAQSEGFAAVHNGAATDEQIVDDLLSYLEERGFGVLSTDVAGVHRAARAMAERSKHPLGNIKSLEPILVGCLGDAWFDLARVALGVDSETMFDWGAALQALRKASQ